MENIKKRLTPLKVPKERLFLVFAAAFICAVTSVFIFPDIAHAGLFDDIFDLDGWLIKHAMEICNAILQTFGSMMAEITADSILTNGFSKLIGEGEGIYNIAKTVNEIAVQPLGHAILALMALVQLIQIAARADSHGTMPIVKDVAFLALFLTLFGWLIDNSAEICVGIYTEIGKISASMTDANAVGTGAVNALQVGGDASNYTLASILTLTIFVVIAWFFAMAAYLVSYVVVYARAIQMYIMMAFSPIPLSLMGFEQTRSMGINFLKNFAALALANVIMVFILIAFPFVVQSVLGNDAVTIESVDGLLTGLQLVAVCLLLIFGMFKSGAWAREILGG